MKLGALRFRLADSDQEPLDVHAWTGSAADLPPVKEPTVFVVPAGALQPLRGQPNAFNDRGKKHPARPLAALLLRQPRVPLVDTAYASARQLPRSIKDLLAKAVVSGERKAYVLGVPDHVYEECAAKNGALADGTPDSDWLDEVEDLVDDVEVPRSLADAVVGESAQMRLVREWIVRAARHAEPVLVLGETGTGKGVVARAIHDLQFGKLKPFQPINCGAIPTELFESEFFGYVPGAFSNGLRTGSPGVWRRADGGTLFLDELGELMPLHQTKLLRAIETNGIRPVGSMVEVGVNARIVSATNRDLRLMIDSGEFREDLYYRVGVTVITMPRLRDRPDDIAPLANAFWSGLAPKRPALSEDVIKELKRYRWPGNTRELRAVIANISTSFQKSVPTAAHVRAVMRMYSPLESKSDASMDVLERVERLRHLRRTRGAIDACQRLVRGLSARALEGRGLARLTTMVSGALTELQLIAARPTLFERTASLKATNHLVGRLTAFLGLLARDAPDALRYGRRELKEEAAAAWRVVKGEEERLLREL